jgi:hypothetical protein
MENTAFIINEACLPCCCLTIDVLVLRVHGCHVVILTFINSLPFSQMYRRTDWCITFTDYQCLVRNSQVRTAFMLVL